MTVVSSPFSFLFALLTVKGQSHPPPKSAQVGEIGWGVAKQFDEQLLKNDNQIKVSRKSASL